MKNKKQKAIISLVINSLISILLLFVFICYFTPTIYFRGTQCLKFYTSLSNMFLLIASLFYIPFIIKSIKKDEYKIPNWVSLLKYYSTVTVTITFLVANFLLWPLGGYDRVHGGIKIIMHMITPVLAVVTLLFFDTNNKLNFLHTLYNMVPSILYLIYYLLMVFVLDWGDIYEFFSRGIAVTILVFTFIPIITYSLGFLYRFLINKKC